MAFMMPQVRCCPVARAATSSRLATEVALSSDQTNGEMPHCDRETPSGHTLRILGVPFLISALVTSA